MLLIFYFIFNKYIVLFSNAYYNRTNVFSSSKVNKVQVRLADCLLFLYVAKNQTDR